MTHHFVRTSSVLIKNFKIDKFCDFSSDFDFKTKMDMFRDDISLIINQCYPQATEGSLRRTLSVRQPRSASKRSALVYIYIYIYILTIKTRLLYMGNSMSNQPVISPPSTDLSEICCARCH